MAALPEKEVTTEQDDPSMQISDKPDAASEDTDVDKSLPVGEEVPQTEEEKNEEPDSGNSQDLTKSVTTRSEKPYTAFTVPQKWLIVALASAASFFSPLSGQIYFPVLPVLTQNYDLSQSLLNVSVTTYMIFQGLAPSFMGTFSDASGRRPAYIIAFIIYTAANIGLALQNSYAALLVLRCLQSAGSSGTVAFGYGVIADVTTTAERGKYLGPMAAGVMVGPALGPVIGGLLAQYLGWRAVFWFLVVISGGYLVVYAFLAPETHRQIVGDGSVLPAESWRLSIMQYIRIKRRLARMSNEERTEYEETQRELQEQQKNRKLKFPNPLLSFAILLQKDAFMIILFVGFVMFSLIVLMTSLPTIFPEYYGLDELQVGLCFLPLGVSSALGSVINGKILDWNYKRHAQKLGISIDRKRGDDLTNFPIEKARLEMCFIWAGLLAIAHLGYGWALDYKAPLAAPLVILFIIGFSMVCTMNSLTTLLTDIFPGQASTASAASNLLRCILGAVGAAVVDQMLVGMGIGWCLTFVSLVLLVSISLLWFEYLWGMQWRQRRWREKAEKAEMKKRTTTV